MIEEGGKYQVNPFYNGTDLCNAYEEQDEISIVILDFEMPERNGPETAQWIRNYETSKQKKRVPIIGLTGHESFEVKEICIKAGMDQVLTKPINKAELVKMLKELL